MLQTAPKTYIIAGDDAGQENFDDFTRKMAGRPDVVIIRPKPGESLAKAVENAHMQTPANVIIACHGGQDGTITWNKGGTPVAYDALFAALPKQGIGFIANLACFGGSAEQQTAHLPKGCVLFSMAGKTVSLDDYNGAITRLKELNPTNIVIAGLGAFNHTTIEAQLNSTPGNRGALTANDTVSHTISIGGGAPINLDRELGGLSQTGAQHTLDPAAFDASLQRVKQYFDASHLSLLSNKTPEPTILQRLKGEKPVSELEAQINAVAEKIKHGESLSTDAERRIGYALTVAYLDQTGELSRRSAQAVTKVAMQEIPTNAAVSPELVAANTGQDARVADANATKVPAPTPTTVAANKDASVSVA